MLVLLALDRKQLGALLALGLVAAWIAFGTPVHVTPGNGSLRCKNAIVTEGYRYTDDSEGLARMCTRAGERRLAEGIALTVGALLLGFAMMTARTVRWPLGVIAAVVALVLLGRIIGNWFG